MLPSLDPRRAWDVYLLPDSPDPLVVPIGGHYRFSLPSDPTVAPDVHAFAESCAEQRASSRSERLLINQATSTTPTEIHVFLNLRYGYPLGVVVKDDSNGLWFVDEGRISRSGAPTR